jgi:hypothetical protein
MPMCDEAWSQGSNWSPRTTCLEADCAAVDFDLQNFL